MENVKYLVFDALQRDCQFLAYAMKTGIILKELVFSPLKWLEHLDYHLDYKGPEGIPGQKQHLVPVPKGLEKRHEVL